MSRRVKLRLLDLPPPEAPTAEALRRSLGGRLLGPPHPDVGQLVRLDDRAVVVLFADENEAHVWVGEGRVRRVQREALGPLGEAAPASLAKVGLDIAAFARLEEGETVAYLRSRPDGTSQVEHGTLAEKCRYGALVLRGDGVAVGVGFRRLWRDENPMNLAPLAPT